MYNSYKDNKFKFPEQEGSLVVFMKIFTMFALSTFVIQTISLVTGIFVMVYGITYYSQIVLLIPLAYVVAVLVYGRITQHQMEFASGMGVGNGGIMLNIIVFTPLALVNFFT